jgi:nitrogen fixation protein NifB
MTPDEAIQRVEKEFSIHSKLRIVAVSGPGEPLANNETFATLQGIFERHPEVNFCLSTNGTLLRESLDAICEINVSTISVSMSTQNYDIAAQLYEWADIKGRILRGRKMGKEIITRQFSGIRAAAEAGICVKVNTVLIPEVNGNDMSPLSNQISDAGAQLQNIIPLVACGNAINLRTPSGTELALARKTASRNIKQFLHCMQCRSDVIGIPGNDKVL